MPKYVNKELNTLAMKAIATWGVKHQLAVAVEEAGEFIAAASKVINRGEEADTKLYSEVADMIIMIEQLKIMFQPEMVEMLPKKMAKLKGHLDAASNNV